MNVSFPGNLINLLSMLAMLHNIITWYIRAIYFSGNQALLHMTLYTLNNESPDSHAFFIIYAWRVNFSTDFFFELWYGLFSLSTTLFIVWVKDEKVSFCLLTKTERKEKIICKFFYKNKLNKNNIFQKIVKKTTKKHAKTFKISSFLRQLVFLPAS